jgi:hypothetical protein
MAAGQCDANKVLVLLMLMLRLLLMLLLSVARIADQTQ